MLEFKHSILDNTYVATTEDYMYYIYALDEEFGLSVRTGSTVTKFKLDFMGFKTFEDSERVANKLLMTLYTHEVNLKSLISNLNLNLRLKFNEALEDVTIKYNEKIIPND